MGRKSKEDKYYRFKECDVCGKSPAIPRFWNGKYMCSDCAKTSFRKYLAALAAGGALVALYLLIN